MLLLLTVRVLHKRDFVFALSDFRVGPNNGIQAGHVAALATFLRRELDPYTQTKLHVIIFPGDHQLTSDLAPTASSGTAL